MSDCVSCKTEHKQVANVPFVVYESAMARMERTIKRLWIVVLLLVVLLVGSNIVWIVYENSFEDVVVEQEVDTGDGDAFVAGVGDVNYGTSKTEDQISHS